jgi:hypothetical protein
MPPLALNDEEMAAAVMDAAAPIDPAHRGAFLEAVAAELAKCPRGGDWPGQRLPRDPRGTAPILHAAPDLGRDRQTALMKII